MDPGFESELTSTCFSDSTCEIAFVYHELNSEEKLRERTSTNLLSYSRITMFAKFPICTRPAGELRSKPNYSKRRQPSRGTGIRWNNDDNDEYKLPISMLAFQCYCYLSALPLSA